MGAMDLARPSGERPGAYPLATTPGGRRGGNPNLHGTSPYRSHRSCPRFLPDIAFSERLTAIGMDKRKTSIH